VVIELFWVFVLTNRFELYSSLSFRFKMDNILFRLFYANVIGNVTEIVIFKLKVDFIHFFQAYYPTSYF